MPLSIQHARQIRACLNKTQFRHFKIYLYGPMLNGKNEKNIVDISSNTLDVRSQSSLSRSRTAGSGPSKGWTASVWTGMPGARRRRC